MICRTEWATGKPDAKCTPWQKNRDEKDDELESQKAATLEAIRTKDRSKPSDTTGN